MTTFKTVAIAALLAAGSAAGASAATLYATDATIVTDGPRGTANDRANLANTYGEGIGDFFELGFGGVVDFTFGRLFTGAGSLVEVTFGDASKFPETARIQAGRKGVFTDVATVLNGEAQPPVGALFNLTGIYDTLRVIDETAVRGKTGGFDVDRISVSAVPVPAAGALLLGALALFGLVRRRAA